MRSRPGRALTGLVGAGLACVVGWGCPAPSTPHALETNGSGSSGKPSPANAVADDRSALAPADDPLGDSAKSVVYLDQNWSPADSQRFYFTSQGAQILPYDWFLHLEQAGNDQLFRDTKNMLALRYLPQKPDPMNPDGLPVGFVTDEGKDRAWLGFNCSACHTGEVHYKGVAYRVDGAPALADTTGFLRGVTAALVATRDQSDKFDRFAKKVLSTKDGPVARETLKAQLTLVIDRREGYNARNFPPGDLAGNGRIDAFGAILNEVFHNAVPAKDLTSNTANTKPANAPTSIPHLWDAPQHDLLQWNGSARNGGPGNVGALARNTGEVLGVFGDFEIPEKPGPFGYPSSVRTRNLIALEDWLTTLWSPEWPKDFPPIDPAKRDKGRTLFEKNCLDCHKDIDRKDPRRKVVAQMRWTGTDPLMDDNFTGRVGKAGKLQGAWSMFLPLVGQKLPPDAAGGLMLSNAVIGTIVGSPFHPPADDLSTVELTHREKPVPRPGVVEAPAPGPRYKGRPLNGIWATAPYLHNGSVPSLDALLRPAKDRPQSFTVGSREFDPEVVGFKQDAKGMFTFRVVDEAGKPIPGNSNVGHEYGGALSAEERGQLLEYLKSL
jgi:hypothetical protein